MTTKNPILDELHRVREELLENAGGSLAGLVAKLRADQAVSGRKIRKPEEINPPQQKDEGGASIEALTTPLAER